MSVSIEMRMSLINLLLSYKKLNQTDNNQINIYFFM